MSLKYIDHNGVSHDIAGLSPGGDLSYAVSTSRKKDFTLPALSGGAFTTMSITFDEPFDDANYEVIISTSVATVSQCNIDNKTATGFEICYVNNNSSAVSSQTATYYAFKLFTDSDAAQLNSAVTDIQAMIPASASSSNKFATVGDLSTETRSLDRRIDTLEDAVPVGTSISNQLINQTQLTNAIENVEIDVDDALDSTSENPVQNKVIANALQNVEIDVDSAISGTSENPVQNKVIKAALDKKEDVQFTGTKAEWDALSTAEKKEYKIANITDDVIGGEVANVVANGDMRPVTSNAVFQNSPIKIKEYVFAATTTTTEIQITEAEAQDPFIIYGFVHSTNYPYNVSLPWNTEVTAFINRASQILSLTITTSNYYGQAHVFVGHYE